ncbi:VTT domain-containing protein [Planctomycetota bacterium]
MKRLNKLNYAGIDKIKMFLKKGGIAAVVTVRVLPSAPYAVVNSVAGTFDISYRDFIVGTFIAHLPGTLTLALLGKQLKTVLSQPSRLNISILIGILCAGGLLIWLLHNRVKKQMED